MIVDSIWNARQDETGPIKDLAKKVPIRFCNCLFNLGKAPD